MWRSAPVVYVAAEGAEGYAARVLAWCTHFHMPTGSLYFIGEAVRMLDKDELSEFIGAVLSVQPELIVIDTLARCMIAFPVGPLQCRSTHRAPRPPRDRAFRAPVSRPPGDRWSSMVRHDRRRVHYGSCT